MYAIILAAGLSSRLRPLTNELPKCLLSIGEQTILERMISSLKKNNIEEIILVTGFCEEKIQLFIQNKFPAMNIHCVSNPQFATTSNSYSLWYALDYVFSLKNNIRKENSLLLFDADIVFDEQILQSIIQEQNENAVVVVQQFQLTEEEVKVQTENNTIVHIGKDVPPAEASGESIGIEKFSSAVARRLYEILSARKYKDKFYEESFQILIDEGIKFTATNVTDFRCIEIDTAEDYAVAQKIFAQK